MAPAPRDGAAGSQRLYGFATQFAHSYFTRRPAVPDGDGSLDTSGPDERAEALRPFLARGLDPQLGW
ncbi:MAG: hypothetical protein KY434_10920, partial [Actinobacteria bacterium]|nr:hypothetical protein [Actinomycetota bacterium]